MDKPSGLSRESLLSMAKAFGLDVEHPHMENLYSYVQTVLPALRSFQDLDLTGLEPVGPPVVIPSLQPGLRKTGREE